MMIKLKQLLLEAEYSEQEIGKELEKAFSKGPVATRAFLNSPMGQHAALNSLLKKPEPATDGDQGDDKIKVTGPADIDVDPKKMQPTQNFIDAMKSVAFPLGSAKAPNISTSEEKGFGTIVISDNLIIDGHHRWSAVVALTPDGTINALDVEWPGDSPAQKLAAAQIAIASTLQPATKQPSATGDPATDILGKGKDVVAKIIMDNVNKQPDKKAPGPLLNDKMMEVLTQPGNIGHKTVMAWLGIEEFTEAKPEDADKLRQAIANKVGENLALITKDSTAPDRDDMPQFDPKVGGPELKAGGDLATALSTGKINVSPPFVKDGIINLKSLLGNNMEPAKRFNNAIIGQFVLAGAPTKVYVNGSSLTITDEDDVENPLMGFGVDEKGRMIQFDYNDVEHLLIAGNKVSIETYNKAMEDKFTKKSADDSEEEKPEGKDEPAEEPDAESMKDHYNIGEKNMNLRNIVAEISQEEVDAEMDAAKSEIDAAKAKAKAAKAAEKDTVKAAKDKMKAAKANLKVATEDIVREDHEGEGYTFGTGDIVNNKHTSCPHFGSKGIVIELPANGMVRYAVTNNGANHKPGDVLTKPENQLEKI